MSIAPTTIRAVRTPLRAAAIAILLIALVATATPYGAAYAQQVFGADDDTFHQADNGSFQVRVSGGEWVRAESVAGCGIARVERPGGRGGVSEPAAEECTVTFTGGVATSIIDWVNAGLLDGASRQTVEIATITDDSPTLTTHQLVNYSDVTLTEFEVSGSQTSVSFLPANVRFPEGGSVDSPGDALGSATPATVQLPGFGVTANVHSFSVVRAVENGRFGAVAHGGLELTSGDAATVNTLEQLYTEGRPVAAIVRLPGGNRAAEVNLGDTLLLEVEPFNRPDGRHTTALPSGRIVGIR